MQRKIVERCFYDLKFKAHTVTVISSTNAFDDDNFCELIKKNHDDDDDCRIEI